MRTAQKLGLDQIHSDWMDADGGQWRYDPAWGWRVWSDEGWHGSYATVEGRAPYTEIEPVPYVVGDSAIAGAIHAEHEWRER